MTLSLIGIAALLFVAFMGLPLGVAMVAIGFVGFGLARGWPPALEMVGQTVLDLAMSADFASLPLFVLMGVFVYRAGISDSLFAAAQAWLGHLRGGLAMATVLACGGMAAATGSSLATTATMARVAMPPMRRYGYANGLATGAVASGGTLGMLLPPSTSLLVYGILTNQHIGKLFVAGILPGLTLIVLFMAAIRLVVHFRPTSATVAPRASWHERLTRTARVWPVLLLFGAIMAGIYLGVFTASESGAVGAVGALAFALYRRSLNWQNFVASLVEAGTTTAMLFTVGFGALIVNNFVAVAGLPGELVAWIRSVDLSPTVFLLVLTLIFLLLGTVFDGIAMILLTVPVFFPVTVALGHDPIWFGIFVVIMAELSVISPPVGMNVFVIRAMYPEIGLWEVFNGTWPFFFAALVLVALIVAVPSAVLWLPGFMK